MPPRPHRAADIQHDEAGHGEGSEDGAEVGQDRTGWSIKKVVRTARRYRTVQIRAGNQILTAADLPRDLRDVLALIN